MHPFLQGAIGMKRLDKRLRVAAALSGLSPGDVRVEFVRKEPPPGLQLEVMVRKDLIQVADRNSGPLATMPNTPTGYDYDALTEYLKRVKAKFPEKTDASILLEADTPYDTLVQVMDRVRVFEVSQGMSTVQAELFPDISIGDAPALADAGSSAAPAGNPAGNAPPGKNPPKAMRPPPRASISANEAISTSGATPSTMVTLREPSVTTGGISHGSRN